MKGERRLVQVVVDGQMSVINVFDGFVETAVDFWTQCHRIFMPHVVEDAFLYMVIDNPEFSPSQLKVLTKPYDISQNLFGGVNLCVLETELLAGVKIESG